VTVTPEAKIKKLVNKLLDEFVEDLSRPKLYRFWPVPGGFGASSLDCLVCYYGFWIGIECKAPGKEPTPRQFHTINQMLDAGAHVRVISSEESLASLKAILLMIKMSHANANHS
jgi:hypothetical protein